jgi:hypothetical protein
MTPTRALVASFAASLAIAGNALAASAPAPTTDATRLSSQYSEWAGGRENADSLVAGLRNGAPITLVTNGANRAVSIAGFTPTSSMSYGGVGTALANARSTLARAGFNKPTAEQIQAALIGGEITTSNGKTTMVKGSVAPRGTTPLASR